MGKLISLGFGALFGYLVDFLMTLLNFFTKTQFSLGLTSLNVLVATAFFSFLTSIIIVIMSIYSLFLNFITTLNNYSFNVNSNDLINTSFSLLKTTGVLDAFYDTFSVFLPIPFAFFSLFVLKSLLKIAKEKREAYYKFVSLLDGNSSGKNTYSKNKKK